jgi:regulator of protease activity HflC (stomatin/prohibitin superfamily)
MEGALAWIGQIAEWVGRFVPRWEIIPTTHGGVKFVKGHKVVPLGPGLHFFWPLVTELTTYPMARQAVDLRTQTFVTHDDKVIAVGGLIVYEIKDIAAILAHTYDPQETIRDITATAIHDVCCQKSWDELKAGQRSGSLDRDLRRETAKGLDSYGVKVLKTTLTDLAPCRVLKVISSSSKDG